MVRATTGGVLKSYRYNLMNSFISSNRARQTVLTQRVFNSYAEDPAAAAKSFRLRKSRMMTSSQLSVCQDSYYKHSAGFQCLLTIDELIDTTNGKGTAMTTLKGTTLEMLNDPMGDARVQLTKVLDQLSETIVQNLNQTYGDDFIFAGADGDNVPFTVEEENGVKKLFYRGVSVDAYLPELMMDGDNRAVLKNVTPTTYVRAGTNTVEKAELDALPPLETNAGGAPVTISGTDGNTYYVKQSKLGSKLSEQDLKDQLTAAGVPDDELEEKLKKEKEKYIEISEFKPPLDDNELYYYAKDDVILKSEYDKVNDSVMRDENGNPYSFTMDGKEYYVAAGEKDPFITEEAYTEALQEAEKLDYLMKEKRFVDIGLGFQEDENGKLIESSAFNDALNGLTFLGYGVDEDGDPKNIYSIVQKLKGIAESVPEEGTWSTAVYEEFRGMVLKLEDASSNFKTEFTNMDAGTQKLKNNMSLLEDNVYSLKEQYSNIEDVDMADAITSFIWAEYCYNAALKVGNSILSQSLMDYLN